MSFSVHDFVRFASQPAGFTRRNWLDFVDALTFRPVPDNTPEPTPFPVQFFDWETSPRITKSKAKAIIERQGFLAGADLTHLLLAVEWKYDAIADCAPPPLGVWLLLIKSLRYKHVFSNKFSWRFA